MGVTRFELCDWRSAAQIKKHSAESPARHSVEHLHAARTYGAVVMNPNAFVHCELVCVQALTD